MQTKHIPFEEVYDLYAARIVFECDDESAEKRICWNIYNEITEVYAKHPDRVRDWLTTPKVNKYRALHVTVMGPDGNWVEVQIRSRKMDDIAERGFAAHWKYKIGESEEEDELAAWLGTITDILKDPEPNAIDFLDTIKLNLFASEIVVFTPKGETMTLPKGASVLDVAFILHTDLGTHCIAGKVNHKLVPLSYKLSGGDQVEILTSQSNTPKAEWEKYLVTAKGKTRLRSALKHQRRLIIEEGEKRFMEFLKQHNIEFSNEVLSQAITRQRIASSVIRFNKKGSIVVASGTTTVTGGTEGGVYSNNVGVTVMGPGKLIVKSTNDKYGFEGKGTSSSSTLIFKNVTVEASGKKGATYDWASVYFYPDTHVTLKATNDSNYPVAWNIEDWPWDEEAILAPWGAYYSISAKCIMYNGSPMTAW